MFTGFVVHLSLHLFLLGFFLALVFFKASAIHTMKSISCQGLDASGFISSFGLLYSMYSRGFLLKRLCKFLVCDRGFLDFIIWIITTLEYPGFLNTIYGRFLFR